MLKLINNDDYIAPKRSNDIVGEMRDIVWARTLRDHLTPHQLKRVRKKYRRTDFSRCYFRGLSDIAKTRITELKRLNIAYLDAVEREQAPRIDLDIIHFETESLRMLRANLANHGKRKAKTAKHRNTRHPNKRRW